MRLTQEKVCGFIRAFNFFRCAARWRHCKTTYYKIRLVSWFLVRSRGITYRVQIRACSYKFGRLSVTADVEKYSINNAATHL